ncbi:MAG: DUF1963 domain-containing protein [Clostridia bacterium]|nr:DUF1963 domain-containing protein [Clostridia bacterium]
MNYYILRGVNGHVSLLNHLDLDTYQRIKSDNELDDIQEIEFELNDELGRKPLNDCNWSPLNLSKGAFEILFPFIKNCIYKPIEGYWMNDDTKELVYVLRIKDRIDCLDRERSVYSVINENFYVIENYVIDESKTDGRMLLEMRCGTEIIVSQEFVDLVERNNLTGFRFDRILTTSEYDALLPEDRPRARLVNCDSVGNKATVTSSISSSKPMVKDVGLLKKLIKSIAKRTKRNAFVFDYDFGHQCSLYDSKIGGIPYWDASCKEFPTDEEGNKMIMLAQINLGELPPEVKHKLPKTGLLQFYISENYQDTGLSTDKICQVVYHDLVDEKITIEEVIKTEIKTTLEALDFPIYGEAAIKFSTKSESMIPSDYRYSSYDIKDSEGKRVYTDEDNIMDILSDEECESLFDDTRQSKLLGYPFFEQLDPREDYREYDDLLLQIDSYLNEDNKKLRINWGLGGTCNFFIRSLHLEKHQFDDVLFNWDCS